MSDPKHISDTGIMKQSGGSDHYWRAIAERYGMDIAVKRAMAKDLDGFPYKREYLCEQISKEVARRVTLALMDAFLAESKSHRMPVSMIPAWVRVTGSRRLLDLICGACGLTVADDTERQFADLGRALIQREKIESEVSVLRADLWDKA